MDNTRLAYDVVARLAPFLKGLLAKHPLRSNAPAPEQHAHELWQVIYPKVALRSGVMLAARKIIEQDTLENRKALSMQLALVFRTNTFLAARVLEHVKATGQDRSVSADRLRTAPPTSFPQARSENREYGADQVTCQVCGAQDETLRLVSYPYVFSLVVITFRRMFQGVYCSRHANRYFFLAGFISLFVGWMGIPFGLIFTPITLFNLFTSENRLRAANAKLLMEIGKAKYESGSPQDAAVYYREALWLNDKENYKQDAGVVSRLKIAETQHPVFLQVFSLVGGFSAAWLLGFLIGLVDALFSSPFNDIEGQVTILVIIFSYIPLVLMLYFGSFILARFIRRMLERTQISSLLVGRIVAGFASLITVYAILTANLFFHIQLSSQQDPVTLFDAIRINGLLLVHGGWLILVGLVQHGSTADLLFVVLVIFGFMSFIWLGQDWASRTIRWRKVMQEIQGVAQPVSSVMIGLSAILVVGIVFVTLGLIFIPSSILLN